MGCDCETYLVKSDTVNNFDYEHSVEGLSTSIKTLCQELLELKCPVCDKQHTITIETYLGDVVIHCSNCCTEFTDTFDEPYISFNIQYDRYPGNDIINFGKYRNIAVINLLHADPGYLRWMIDQEPALDARYEHLLEHIPANTKKTYNPPPVVTSITKYINSDYLEGKRGNRVDYSGLDWDDMGSCGDDEHGDWMCASEY